MPVFSGQQIQAISKVLADTETGLTGAEIAHLLAECRIPDIDDSNTKWKRLANAFSVFQNKHQAGNHVAKFTIRAMDPASYTDKPAAFRLRRDRLNAVLAFCGMQLGDDGQLRRTSKVTTIDQALERASRLRSALVQRGVHRDVLKFCSAELLAENFFHAVFEAMKSITVKIRALSGLTSDGVDLVHGAFGLRDGDPLLAINALNSETLIGEQYGFVNLLKGLYGTIRNPLAHDPKIDWNMDEQDALDILTMISLVHRKLDKAHVFSRRQPRQ